MNLKAVLEGLLFIVGDEGLTFDEIKSTLEINDDKLNEIIESLKNDYLNIDRGLNITILGNRLKLTTKKEHKEYFQKLMTLSENDNLSESALEVLAIVAYNQPVTRIMVDEIRGVDSSYLIRKLVYRNLIGEVGRAETAGRPVLYGTTDLFLDYFGLKSISELPKFEIKEDDSIKELYNSKYKEENL